MSQCHPRLHLKSGAGQWVGVSGRPFSRPTNRHHHSFILPLDIKEREKLTGGSTAAWLETHSAVVAQNPRQRPEIVHRTRGTLRVVNGGVTRSEERRVGKDGRY